MLGSVRCLGIASNIYNIYLTLSQSHTKRTTRNFSFNYFPCADQSDLYIIFNVRMNFIVYLCIFGARSSVGWHNPNGYDGFSWRKPVNQRFTRKCILGYAEITFLRRKYKYKLLPEMFMMGNNNKTHHQLGGFAEKERERIQLTDDDARQS